MTAALTSRNQIKDRYVGKWTVGIRCSFFDCTSLVDLAQPAHTTAAAATANTHAAPLCLLRLPLLLLLLLPPRTHPAARPMLAGQLRDPPRVGHQRVHAGWWPGRRQRGRSVVWGELQRAAGALRICDKHVCLLTVAPPHAYLAPWRGSFELSFRVCLFRSLSTDSALLPIAPWEGFFGLSVRVYLFLSFSTDSVLLPWGNGSGPRTPGTFLGQLLIAGWRCWGVP